jgi:hypothetical protein
MNYTIKNAKDLDPYTPIMALSNGGCANHYLAGEIGEGTSCKTRSHAQTKRCLSTSQTKS